MMNASPHLEATGEPLIHPMRARDRELLLRQWDSYAETLMDRDGTDTRFKDGGHRIKQNPLLTAAIEEIRDGYFAI